MRSDRELYSFRIAEMANDWPLYITSVEKVLIVPKPKLEHIFSICSSDSIKRAILIDHPVSSFS